MVYNKMLRVTVNNKILSDGEHIPLQQLQYVPTLTIENMRVSDTYILLMLDYDAPGIFLHYLLANYTSRIKGDVLAEYMFPEQTGHRYSFQLYKQLSTIKPPRVRVPFSIGSLGDDLVLLSSVTVISQ